MGILGGIYEERYTYNFIINCNSNTWYNYNFSKAQIGFDVFTIGEIKMKKFLNAKNIIAAVAVSLAVVGGVFYGIHAQKADADVTSEPQTKITAQQKVEQKAVENQVKKVTNEKKIHASESTVHVGRARTENNQFGRHLRTYCAIPIQNDSDWAILVTVKFIVTVYDSAWKREITNEEVVQKTIMSHSSGVVEFEKSYTTAEFVSGNYEIIEVREIFGKGVN